MTWLKRLFAPRARRSDLAPLYENDFTLGAAYNRLEARVLAIETFMTKEPRLPGERTH